MSNARKKRKQASIDKRIDTMRRLDPIRKAYIRKIRWINFIHWLKSLIGWK
jgi:hypothetical protein